MSKDANTAFYWDTVRYANGIAEQCAYTVPRIVDKKEQLSLGIIYLSFIIEKLSIHYGKFDHKKHKYYFMSRTFWMNNFFVPRNIPLNVHRSYTEEHLSIHSISYCALMADIIGDDWPEVHKWGKKIKALAYKSGPPSNLIDTEEANNFFDDNEADLFGFNSGFFKLCQENDKYLETIKHNLEEIVYKSDTRYREKNKQVNKKIKEALAGNFKGIFSNWLNKK